MLRLIGGRIRKIREDKGWSQEKLADECNLHRTYIGAIERGGRNITILNLIRVARALGITSSELLKGVDCIGQSEKND